jgi:cell wall-associated NlpC family hydrolase
MTPTSSRVQVAVSVADIHREPAHESELVTQAAMALPLKVRNTAEEGRWLHVELPDAYVGWVRSWLVTPVRRGWPAGHPVEIDQPLTWIRSEPEPEADPVSDVVIGTRLERQSGGPAGWVRVSLPDGRLGFLPRADLLSGGRPLNGRRRERTAAALLATARRFLGVPYVWGGRSPKGLDCSGFTQMVFDLHDFDLPRDSKDQRTFLERQGAVVPDPLATPPGGLLFFGRNPDRASHVGISLGGGDFIHAQGWVRFQSIEAAKPLFSKELSSLFQVACKLPKNALGG